MRTAKQIRTSRHWVCLMLSGHIAYGMRAAWMHSVIGIVGFSIGILVCAAGLWFNGDMNGMRYVIDMRDNDD